MILRITKLLILLPAYLLIFVLGCLLNPYRTFLGVIWMVVICIGLSYAMDSIAKEEGPVYVPSKYSFYEMSVKEGYER